MYEDIRIGASTLVDVFYESKGQKNLRLKTELIGYSIGRFILLRLPKRTAEAALMSAGHNLTIRAVSNRNVMEMVIFRAVVQRIATVPDKLVVMEYPVQIERRAFRTEPRIRVDIAAAGLIDLLESPLDGRLQDISQSGCCFCTEPDSLQAKTDQPFNISNLVGKSCELTLDLQDANAECCYQLKATIKNVYTRAQLQLGMKFDHESRNEAEQIFYQFITDELML